MALTSSLAGALHRVVLLKDRDNPNLYKARPAYPAASRTDKVRFVNLTQGQVTIQFPDGDPFGQGPLTIGIGTRSADLVILDNVPDGRYRFVGTVNGQEIQGESSPEIIIDG